MLFNLLAPLADQFAAFNLFRYLTFRSGGAVMTALVISFIMGPRTIRAVTHLDVDAAGIDRALEAAHGIFR